MIGCSDAERPRTMSGSTQRKLTSTLPMKADASMSRTVEPASMRAALR